MHHREYMRERDKWADLILVKYQNDMKPDLSEPVAVYYERRYARNACDWDNACASFKVIGDALEKVGVITEDSPEVIDDFDPDQKKVPTEDESGAYVQVEEIDNKK